MSTHTTSSVKHPRLMLAMLIAVIVVGAANLALYAVTQAPMQIVLGVVLMAAGAINIVRLQRAT